MSDKTARDLTEIAAKWLQQCGPCDGGLPMGCSHPDEDYRPTMAELLARAESAEVALAGLREGIEALVDEAMARPHRGYVSALALRALLAPTPDRKEARNE